MPDTLSLSLSYAYNIYLHVYMKLPAETAVNAVYYAMSYFLGVHTVLNTIYTVYILSYPHIPLTVISLYTIYITLHFTAFSHSWADAKLHFIVSVIMRSAMTVQLNLI